MIENSDPLAESLMVALKFFVNQWNERPNGKRDHLGLQVFKSKVEDCVLEGMARGNTYGDH